MQVGEPSEEKAILMMRGMASTLEKHHRVQVLDEALESSVRLSHRYIPARQLPDKSVSLLDTACARVAISQHAVPAEVDDSRKRIEALENELEIIGREKPWASRRASARPTRTRSSGRRKERLGARERWKREGPGRQKILEIRGKLRGEIGRSRAPRAIWRRLPADEAADDGPSRPAEAPVKRRTS